MQVFQRITVVGQELRNLCAFSSVRLQLGLVYGFGFLVSLLRTWGCSQNITTQKNA